jgi:hypothetical protein
MKRASQPNASEREYMNNVAEFGCICCYIISGQQGTPAAIHHVFGSRRSLSTPEPHKQVLGLCGYHHQGVGEFKEGGYVHGRKKEFEEMFGSQQSLIDMTRECI